MCMISHEEHSCPAQREQGKMPSLRHPSPEPAERNRQGHDHETTSTQSGTPLRDHPYKVERYRED